MAACLPNDDYSSDDEVFIGPMTMTQVKKILFPNISKQLRRNLGCRELAKYEESLKLIEVHSTPNVLVNKEEYKPPPNIRSSSEVDSSWDLEPDDSFLQIEKMVSDLSVNTRDIIEQISKKPHTKVSHDFPKATAPPSTAPEETTQTNLVSSSNNQKPNSESPIKKDKSIPEEFDSKKEYFTPIKQKVPDTIYIKDKSLYVIPEQDNFTPIKQKVSDTIYSTPESRVQTPIFKTLGVPVSQTPDAKKSFQHVLSPVAVYINNSPVVPLFRDVRPKKPLASCSGIPRPVKRTTNIPVKNKENYIKLPQIAYKAAKGTIMIDTPNEEKMPQSQWTNQLVASVSRATVIRHDQREGNVKEPLEHQSENSFGNLSLHQAEVSVCIKKSAYNKGKKFS